MINMKNYIKFLFPLFVLLSLGVCVVVVMLQKNFGSVQHVTDDRVGVSAIATTTVEDVRPSFGDATTSNGQVADEETQAVANHTNAKIQNDTIVTAADVTAYFDTEGSKMESFCKKNANAKGTLWGSPVILGDLCYSSLASSLVAPKECDNISDADKREQCRDDTQSIQIDNDSKIKTCFDGWVDNVCIKTLAETAPKQWYVSPNESTSYPLENKYAQAIQSKDVTFCDTFSFYGDKSQCYAYFGMALNNPDYCESASYENVGGPTDYDGGYREMCYQSLALANLNSAYCEKITVDENGRKACGRYLSDIQQKLPSCEQSGTDKSGCIAISLLRQKANQSCHDSVDAFIVFGAQIELSMATFKTDACYKTLEKQCSHLSTNIGQQECRNELEDDLNATKAFNATQ